MTTRKQKKDKQAKMHVVKGNIKNFPKLKDAAGNEIPEKLLITGSTIAMSDGNEITIYHSLEDPNSSPKADIMAAIANWSVRTSEHTAESLCDYINSKRESGLTNHWAFTKEFYEANLKKYEDPDTNK
jgi:hypothetical protein